ncbi:hypothetical protein A6A04_17780 [Paramagnetospirillum marisnigri]|uniref:Glycosyltransferase n=1 Tax=Paramagnetospirillum marisnigri TaxID=1285242 RepID=A0A178MPN7_9PROT|nr:hypothetical protein [Paramagnetospirillum marisnigri]OAN50676.1 hypothetical protein A6A04_17780 [Paramagnetospirillum marisnigri]
MWFNILTHNHHDMETIESLAPVLDHLRRTLSLCGHEVSVVHDQVYPDAINLYLEHFPKGAGFAERFRALRRQHGVKIGVIATELMIGGAIPYGRFGITHPDPSYIPDRVAGFNAVAQEVDFLWCLLERTAKEYRNRAAVTEFFPLGYVGSEGVLEARRSPRDLPAVFFGKLTPHRGRTLHSIIAAGVKVVAVGHGFPMGWQSSSLTTSLQDRACIGLNLTFHSAEDSKGKVDPRFASCLRIVDMLSRGTLVVSEEIPFDNPYRPFMVNASVEDLPEVCRSIITEGNWGELAAENSARFRTEMDVRALCGPVIERTLAALDRPAAAKRKKR